MKAGTPGETRAQTKHSDVVVIGSGFGGSLACWPLVREGLDVTLLERGPWVERGPHNWSPEGTLTRTRYFNGSSHYRAVTGDGSQETTSCSCVGGASVFYGAVSLRYRWADFVPNPEIVTDSGARWPFDYDDLRPYYREAERILGVAGEGERDPTAPYRRDGFPGPLNSLSTVARRIGRGARDLGLNPFRLPLAINYGGNGNGTGGQSTCRECSTCDTFACAIEAKNDLATRVLPRLLRRGLALEAETAVTRLVAEDGKIVAAECRDPKTGDVGVHTADVFVLAAGALGTPHLLLASDLAEMNPAGDAVGRYLTRHCSATVYGGYPWIPRYESEFHKQLGINDFYFGDPRSRGPAGKLGNIQQTQTPSMGTVSAETSRVQQLLLKPLVRRSTGLLVLAEDRPRYRNRVHLDPSETDELGLPRLVIHHEYTDRDLDARRFLIDRAKEIHRSAGALACYVHYIDTFSHALGTVRMGQDSERDPLHPDGRFRGLENLYVTDGSALPTSGGVNPSLTIAANGLRVGTVIAGSALAEAS